MKRIALLGIASLMGVVPASLGDGYILLDNYNSYYGTTYVSYGAGGVPLNGVSGEIGLPGWGLQYGWTAGIYFALGALNITDPAGNGIPNSNLGLGTGPGSTVAICSTAGGAPGYFISSIPFDAGGVAGGNITAEIVAYSGSSYATSLYRGHSDPFIMTTYSASMVGTINPNTGFPYGPIADLVPAFNVTPTPEPATLALVVLGGIISFSTLRRTPSKRINKDQFARINIG